MVIGWNHSYMKIYYNAGRYIPCQFFSAPGGVIHTRLNWFTGTECSHDRKTALYGVCQVLSKLIWKETTKIVMLMSGYPAGAQ